MLTHSWIAELTLQLSGRLARPGQDPRAQRTGTSVGVGAFKSAIRATALGSAPIRTTSPTNDPMARRHSLSPIMHKAAVFAVAGALSGAAADVAAARGGGGFGGEGGHIGGILPAIRLLPLFHPAMRTIESGRFQPVESGPTQNKRRDRRPP
jgi:hypothetical protein